VMARAASVVLFTLLACGAGARESGVERASPRVDPPTPEAPEAPEAECARHLYCNAPVCSCTEGYRCHKLCDEPRPGCAECVAR
jgi:hypothetical protein